MYVLEGKYATVYPPKNITKKIQNTIWTACKKFVYKKTNNYDPNIIITLLLIL